MPEIKVVGSEIVYQVSESPQWKDGVWECGNIRFVDIEQAIYEPVSGTDELTPAPADAAGPTQ